MKNYTLLILEEAEQEIIDAFEWYENKRIGLGEQFIIALNNCFSIIDINPNTFQKVYKEHHQAIVRGFPYVVMYENANNKIIVYAVFHTSQKPSKKFRH